MSEHKDYYDIAVIGESMSGKSTFIANLFTKDITQQLESFTQNNKCGQTKLPVRYNVAQPSFLKDGDVDLHSLTVKSIEWDVENLANLLLHPDKENAIYSALELFHFPALSRESDMQQLQNHIKSLDYKTLPLDTLMQLVNDEEIRSKHIISFITLQGAANDEVQKLLEQKELNYIQLRDTRGFLDETIEQMTNYLEKIHKAAKSPIDRHFQQIPEDVSEEYTNLDYVNDLLNDRGLSKGLDGCIFMSIASANTLSKENCRKIYGPLLRTLLSSFPTVLLIRTDMLARELHPDCSDKLADYNDAVKNICDTEWFSGFHNLDRLIEETVLDIKKDTLYSIITKHRSHCMLADISVLKEKNPSKSDAIYAQSVIGVLANTLDSIASYHNDIHMAADYLQQLTSIPSPEATEIFNKCFKNSITYHFDTKSYSTNCLATSTKSLVDVILHKPYFGGLVGVRGGLSTWIPNFGHVGKYAIDLLQTAHAIRRKLLSKFIESLRPKIQAYTDIVNSKEVTIQPDTILQNIQEYYIHTINHNTERLYCTYDMVPREYLKTAYDQTKAELTTKEGKLSKYIEDLEVKPANVTGPDSQWIVDRAALSLIKMILLRLVNLDDIKLVSIPELKDAITD